METLEDTRKQVAPILESQGYDRIVYTKGKTEFIVRVTAMAKRYYKQA